MSAIQKTPQSLEAPPKRKRVKIDVACDTCRARKIKCDGVRPACGNCYKKPALRGRCIYSHNSGSNAPRRSLDVQFDRQETRGHEHLRRGSSAFASSQTLTNNVQLSRLNGNASHSGEILRPPSASNPSPADKSTGEYSGASRPAVHNISPSVIDSMTAVVDEGTSTREYFGSSSAGSFTMQIKRAIEAKLGKGNQYFPSRETEAESASRRARLAPTISTCSLFDDTNRVLPTRRQADHLMGLYWTYVDPLYPFLDRDKWETSYRGIFDGSFIIVDERIFLATLNVVFALSTQLFESQTKDQRDELSNVYFNRAQDLLPLNTWEAGSIELVQYLLLSSQYLQSTDHPHQTWMTVGSAVRIAQGLGLHLRETSAEHTDEFERELLRRVWYGCVLMDRMVAVTHGRPSMISPSLASVVPLPQQGGVGTTDASFFVKSVELYELIHRTIRTLYHGTGARCKNVAASDNGSSAEGEEHIDLGIVMQLDSALGRWERKLPEGLKCVSAEPGGEVTRRQAVILHIRLLHARILLLRPVLASFCLAQDMESSGVSETLENRVLRECALLCVSTAQGVISTLLKYQTADGTVGPLPAWWYRVYYVHTAATILIAAKLRPEVFSGADLGRSWCQAMSVLKAHEKFGQSARRCVAALHFLSAKMAQDGGATAAPEPSRGGMGPGDDGDEHGAAPGPTEIQQTEGAEEFPLSFGDLEDLGFQDVEFDVNNLSWLNDMHGTWELLNQR